MNDLFTPWPRELSVRYRQEGLWIDRPLTQILLQQVRSAPDKIALIAEGQSLTYEELYDMAANLAGYLQERGFRSGHKALVQLGNGRDFYVVFWALMMMGVTPVFPLPSHSSHELESYLHILQPELVIISRHHPLFRDDGYLRDLQRRFPCIDHTLVQGDGRDASLSETSSLDDVGHRAWVLRGDPGTMAADLALFQLSGGSTGTPKLVPRTHNDYYYSIRRSAQVCRLTSEVVYLCALPCQHNFPMSSPGALGVWYAGGTVVTARSPDPRECFSLIERHGVTMTSLVPSALGLWLDAASGESRPWRSLQVLQVGGAKLHENLARKVEPTLGCRLQQVFGMAEGLVCYTDLEEDSEQRFLTQGRPMSDADEVKVVSDAGDEVPVGHAGLLKTRGPYTFRGYYQAPEVNSRVFDEDGFYITGDLVQMSPDGSLTVVGRVKEQINRGGEKIAPAELEQLLADWPGCQTCAVVPMPDAVYGEKICVFMVMKDAPAPKLYQLRKHLRAKGLAEYKFPDHCETIAEMPLTPVGKPDKSALRTRIAQKLRRMNHHDYSQDPLLSMSPGSGVSS